MQCAIFVIFVGTARLHCKWLLPPQAASTTIAGDIVALIQLSREFSANCLPRPTPTPVAVAASRREAANLRGITFA
jgi:hypothetical protein